MIRRKFASNASSSSSSSSTSSLHELNFFLNNNGNDFLTYEKINNFNTFSWWKAQEHNYFMLTTMACDLLIPPMSTIVSVTCFMAGKRVLDDKKSRMNQRTLQMCICLKDLLDAEIDYKIKKDMTPVVIPEKALYHPTVQHNLMKK